MNSALQKNKRHKKNLNLIIVILVLIIIAFFLFSLRKKHEIEVQNTVSIFSTEDSSISLSIPDKYKFSELEADSYLLILNSSAISSNIYFSEVTTNNIRDIFKFIEGDKNDYISKFSNISKVSEISETNIGDLPAYTYNFYYRENMYVSVYWILKGNKFIVIDFNINTEKVDVSIIDEILSNLTLN